MANLTKEDGAGIQILLRPANTKWIKKSLSLSSNIKKIGTNTQKNNNHFKIVELIYFTLVFAT